MTGAGGHFISYSGADGADIALRLAEGLEGGTPPVRVWFDKFEKQRHRLRPGEFWPQQLTEGLRACEGLIFVVTPDSVGEGSNCLPELYRADSYRKPLIPVRADGGARVEVPLPLAGREQISFDRDFDAGLIRLREHILWLRTPEGTLRELQIALSAARRDLARAGDENERRRTAEAIAVLETRIEKQRELVEDPARVAREADARIAAGVARERQPQPQRTAGRRARFPVVNRPPGEVPTWFQDRHDETALLVRHVEDPAIRLVTVVGRAGAGKTTFVCRLLAAMEQGQWADGAPAPGADGLVYLSAAGTRRISLPTLYGDLCKLLPEARAAELMAESAQLHRSTAEKMEALLGALPEGRVLVLLDNLEDLIEPVERKLHDPELGDALRAILEAPSHAVKVVITTRVAPRDVLKVNAGRQAILQLDGGLPSPFAENILRERDSDGKLRLKTAPDALLAEARERTQGYPRALEALFQILALNNRTSLREVLDDTAAILPEDVMDALVGEAFSRLDSAAQRAMQALAIYARPVAAEAVDALLRMPPAPVAEAASTVLDRLVGMQLVRKEARRYYLHRTDQAYALGRIPRETQIALLAEGAGFLRQARQDPSTWRSLDDIWAPLAEFDLRCAAGDYAEADAVLAEFDVLLAVWGHYTRSLELNRRLEGKLDDDWRPRMSNADSLSRLGRYREAIDAFDALLARVGDTGSIAEHMVLYRLGWCWAELGDTPRAMEYSQRALAIARARGDSVLEGDTLSLIGWYHGKLGATSQALADCEHAVELVHGGSTNSRGAALANVAGILLDAARWDDAIRVAGESLRVDPDTRNLRNWNGGFIARACLAKGDLAAARAAAEEARQYDEAENNAQVLALLGIICLRQGQRDAAADAFRTAIEKAEPLIRFSSNQGALDAKGIALAGAALCGDEASPPAADSHRAARACNRDAGVIRRVEWLYDAMGPADPRGLLAVARRWD